MTPANDLDIGPLTWVKGEIDAALSRAQECLAQARTKPGESEPLRFAQSHVHQASGALSVVGVEGVSQFAEAIDKLLAALAAGDLAVPETGLAIASRALGALANYLNELATGSPHQPLRLYPLYAELINARGGEAPPRSELFYPDLSVRPPMGPVASTDPERLPLEVRAARARFERGLLGWIRQPKSPAGPDEMLAAVRRIEQLQAAPAGRTFWWAAIAFFEGLGQQAIAPSRDIHRLCRRIDMQMRRLLEGSPVVAERLVRDVLYHVANAEIRSPQASAVRRAFRLDAQLPRPGAELAETPLQPLARAVREALEHAKEAWNRFCAGAAVGLPQFQEHLNTLARCARELRQPDLDRLLARMDELAQWLRADPLRHSDALGMEVATALLLIEQLLDEPGQAQQRFVRQVDLLTANFGAWMRGTAPAPLDAALFGETSRRAQERLFFNQLAREILTNLGQVEQTLDSYFRDPLQREPLTGLGVPLKQIEGAFSMLGETQAAELVRSTAGQIEALSGREAQAEIAECEALAHQLSALGFYVDALKHGPAQLDRFLFPDRGDTGESAQTVETELSRQTREAQSLVEALKDTPRDERLLAELESNLEALREDAQLLANTTLEQQTKEALATLRAGHAPSEQLAEALAAVAPAAAPAPSADAARLLEASTEEVDAELLAIFLEEAREVLGSIAEHRAQAEAEPHNQEVLTTIRRGFHTLKGSSRMVGLQHFSDAAKALELSFNRWLQLERDANPSLLALIDHAQTDLDTWVAQLEAGGPTVRDASALIGHAERILAALDGEPAAVEMPGLPVSPPAADQATVETSPADSVAALPAEVAALDLELEPFNLPDEAGRLVEASLEETRIDLPLLAALGFDDAPPPAVVEPLPELSLEEPATPTEIDLSGTLAVGSLDLLLVEEQAAARHAPPSTAAQPDAALSELDLASTFVHLPLAQMGADEPSLAPEEPAALDLEIDLALEAEEAQARGELPAIADSASWSVSAAPPAAPDFPPGADDSVVLEAEPVELMPIAAPEDNPPAPSLVTETAAWVESTAPAAPSPTGASIPDLPPTPSWPTAVSEPYQPEPYQPPYQTEPQPEAVPQPTVATEPLEMALEDDSISLAALGAEPAVEEALGEPALIPEIAVAPAEIEPDSVVIGDQTLSRGLFDLYLGEARQHIATLKDGFARLRANPLLMPEEATERAAHTLSGISGTARIEPAQHLGKALELAQGRLREADTPSSAEQTELFARATDALDAMLSEVAQLRMPLPAPELSALLDALVPQPAVIPVMSPAEADAVISVAAPSAPSALRDDLDEQLLPIFFEEAEELRAQLETTLRELRSGVEPAATEQALARLLHTFKGSARMAGAMNLGEHLHAMESRLEESGAPHALADDLESGLDQALVLLAGLRGEPLARPVEPMATATTPLPAAGDEGDSPLGPRANVRVRAELVDQFVNEAGEISIARTRIEGELRTLRRSLLDLTENVIRLRNQLREVEIQAETQMQSRIAAAEAAHTAFDPLEFDRFTRLQEVTRMMAESVGDVTTIQQNLLRNLDGADFALHAQARLSRDLQQALMGVRMVPFEDLADRLYRVARQTAKELGKRVNLDIRGGRIEIDRSVLEKMTAPIEHLLRNAIAHGIESPDARREAGKDEFGQITLDLSQQSNEITLELVDDGRGLDYDRIAERATSLGLLSAGDSADPRRLTQIIFEPGFSTAQEVSEVAGRGVGMDVVKSETLGVGGRLEVESEAGRGARFRIHLPLTLAVTQALLVRAGERIYAVPSSMVEQAMEVKPADLDAMRERGDVQWKDERYPFHYLPRLLADEATQPPTGRYHWVLLLRSGGERVALYIDAMLGNQEIVVKNAGPQFARLLGYSGATVLADGEIALIVNPVMLAARQPQVSLAGTAQVATVVEPVRMPTVMVVDDSLTVRKITGRLLEREGFRVMSAKDGVDALEQLVDTLPDVMLLDIEMPRMDGFDLARNIRADARMRALPIIMITSRTADKHRSYAREIGVNHYLGKPYQEDELLALIRGYTGGA